MSQTKAELVNGLSVNAALADAATIDSSGRILIGHSSARTGVAGMGDPLIQHEGLNSDDSAVSLIRNTNSAFGGSLILGKTRGTSVGANTLVQNGDDIFTIRFAAGDGTDINSECATIKAEIDGVASANDVPGRLAFATTADGAASPTERMRIDSSGRVGIGTTSPSSFDVEGDDLVVSTSGHTGITINSGSAGSTSRGNLIFAEGTAGDSDKTRGVIQYKHGDDYMRFITNAGERMRILSDGKVVIGGTSNAEQQSITLAPNLDDGAGRITFNRANSSNVSIVIQMQNNGSQVGRIEHDNTSCGIFSGSDYRLKENVTAISDGISRLKTLKPSRFNFKVDTEKTVDGFLAHEVSSIVPEAITGTKDQVDSDGNPEYQAIDQSKLVPLLTAALQEEIGKREALEARVATLEAA